MRKPAGYWNIDTVREEAAKYPHRRKFFESAIGAYNAARKGGYLDDVCTHMRTPAPECKPSKWTEQKILKQARDYQDINQFKKDYPGAIYSAQRQGILDKVTAHMEVCTVGKQKRYSISDLSEEAKKYSSRGEFAKTSPTMYRTAARKGLLDEVCSHMSSPRAAYGRWNNKSEVVAEAKKYMMKCDFESHSSGAYNKARAHGYISEACMHMRQPVIKHIPDRHRGSVIQSVCSILIPSKSGTSPPSLDDIEAAADRGITNINVLNDVKDVIQEAFKESSIDMIATTSSARRFLEQLPESLFSLQKSSIKDRLDGPGVNGSLEQYSRQALTETQNSGSKFTL